MAMGVRDTCDVGKSGPGRTKVDNLFSLKQSQFISPNFRINKLNENNIVWLRYDFSLRFVNILAGLQNPAILVLNAIFLYSPKFEEMEKYVKAGPN